MNLQHSMVIKEPRLMCFHLTKITNLSEIRHNQDKQIETLGNVLFKKILKIIVFYTKPNPLYYSNTYILFFKKSHKKNKWKNKAKRSFGYCLGRRFKQMINTACENSHVMKCHNQ